MYTRMNLCTSYFRTRCLSIQFRSMNRFLFCVFYFIFNYCVRSARVTWQPDNRFSLPQNFLNKKLPCSRENVHFKDSYASTIEISSTNEMQSLILPVNGELEFNDGATLKFGLNETDKDCHEGESYYVVRRDRSWWEHDVWKSDSFTAATPDSRRMPCYNDDVVFPRRAQFTVLLPNLEQRVRTVIINGKRLMSDALFKDAVYSSGNGPQSFVLNKDLSVGVNIGLKGCPSRAGCPCQQLPLAADCSRKECPANTCRDPVRPSGNCCFICGGYLEFDIDRNKFDFESFYQQVSAIVDDYGGNASMAYYVGLSSATRVQVVVVDTADDGEAALAVHLLGRRLSGEQAPGFRQGLVSGTPGGRAGVTDAVAGLSFVIVVVSCATVYVVYQRPDLLRLSVPFRHFRNLRSFSRFRGGSVWSIVPPATRAFRASFRNPLFKGDSSSNVTSQDVPTQPTPPDDAVIQQRVIMSELRDSE